MAETLRGRAPFSPEPGKIYELASPSGGRFLCQKLQYGSQFNAWMVNVCSGWSFLAHGVGIYPDGRIDWDYSTGGNFTVPIVMNGGAANDRPKRQEDLQLPELRRPDRV